MKLILVAEDEFEHAEVLQLLLVSAGYRVALASNGREALEQITKEAPALILSDFMMPHMTGAELGQAIRREPQWRDIPFIFISGTTEPVVRQQFNDYDAFAPKPFEIDALLPVIERLLANGRPSNRSREVDESMRHLLKGMKLPPQT
jgi:CheY-like chemotaxis protein